MKINYILILISLVILFVSCEKKNSNKIQKSNVIENQTYTNDKIGWTMKIPVDWEVIEEKKSFERDLDGLKLIESTTGDKYETSEWNNMLAFKKNEQNLFSSTAEKFDTIIHGSWKESNSKLKKIIYNTYLKQGLDADSSITKTEIIDKLRFEYYSFTFYDADKKVILNQICYSNLINGYDLGVNINYDNERDKEEILRKWRNSKFTTE